MKIIPRDNIAIDGSHCPAGVPVEVREATGLAMVQQGFARRAPEPAAADPVVETAATAPAVETAAAHAKPARRKV